MTEPAHEEPAAVEFSREEAWVVHDALLSAIEAAVDAGVESPAELRTLRAVEADEGFDERDLDRIGDALVSYLGDAPLRDRAPGRTALRDVRGVLGEGASEDACA